MSAWKPICAALVIFAAGVVTGGLTIRFNNPRQHESKSAQPESFSRSRSSLLDRMERELYLTTNQTQRVGEILRASQDRTGRLWETIAPQVNAEQKLSRDQIRDVLSESQRKIYDESFKMPMGGRRGFGGLGFRGDGGGRSFPRGNRDSSRERTNDPSGSSSGR